MVSLQHRALIADLPSDQLPSKRESEPLFFRKPKLRPPQEDVLRIERAGHAIEPTALREVAYRYLGGAERLNCLRRHLDVAHQAEL